ncbi:response regulator transcription factor [Burkholderia sp. Ac-20365]|uniref:response regulator transcription factor n=1 Tax=Burkholderia sp. Ac-20365 TaxID=2703897 RepID=UPI00197BEE2C|nr:response regulator transcription factor [Burkholderia sp. Ac-20365]MBN3759236.1 response regulator transcription factor [Burkholderia sp. Ac-20365]
MFTHFHTSQRDIGSKRETERESIVYVVDDDEPTRHSLSALLRSVGLRAETFGSAREFLAFSRPAIPSCLILDVRLPHESGLELQQQLTRMGAPTSIVFISGHGDIPMTVQAMKAGALDFLAKPFRDQDILDAVASALRHDAQRLMNERSMADLRYRYDSMNAKERAVMGYVVAGLMNKQIAAEMNLSEITIKTHRAHAMRKMESRTLAEFVRIGEILGIEPSQQFLSKRD